jgi:hypothetical protein
MLCRPAIVCAVDSSTCGKIPHVASAAAGTGSDMGFPAIVLNVREQPAHADPGVVQTECVRPLHAAKAQIGCARRASKLGADVADE